MGRRPRIDFASALHHVIPRGNRGQILFRDEKDNSSCRDDGRGGQAEKAFDPEMDTLLRMQTV